MKKYGVFTFIILINLVTAVYAISNDFSFDPSKLTLLEGSKQDNIVNNFKKEYNLTHSLSNNNVELENKIKMLSKKTTYLLLGDMNNSKESSEDYYKRHQDYKELAAYNYFPKDPSTQSGYDEKINNYRYVVASELAIPQLFNAFNELGVIYNSYGDIRVTINDNLAISTVPLPNVKIKEENKDNPMKYDYINTNLVIYYYFIEIDNEYRLCYLYGETVDNINKYFDELESTETKNKMAVSASYESNLSSIYNLDKLNNISEEKFNHIYNSNINNIVYLSAYYNNKVTLTANGFFINDGIVVTTWNFLENALIDSQYITIRDQNKRSYQIDGIVTANPETDIAVIKLKNKSEAYVKLGDSTKMSVEDPAITISSKKGTGLVVQKGIIVANDDYIQTTIPLSKFDEGSPLFDKDGNVIGINTSKSTSTSISIAINSNVLKEVQDKLKMHDFDTIETISFEELKENYYYIKYNEEAIVNNIPKNKWKTYKEIGKVEENIKLKLVKANYKDGLVSLRYKNNISKYISSMQLASVFKEQLIIDGYEEILNSSSKCIYKNKKYQIIIMDEFDYLIIVMVKL